MNIYETILSQLKTRFSNLGLGDSVLERVAKQLAGTVDKEELIAPAVDGAEGYLKMMQAELDRVRGEKSGLQKELEELKNAEKERTESEAKAKKAQQEEAAKKLKEEEAAKKARTAAERDKTPQETTEQIIERILKERLDGMAQEYSKQTKKQQEEIEKLNERIRQADEAKAAAEHMASCKKTARELGISEAYDPVIVSFATTAKDHASFEQMAKSFKQSLVDDTASSATPPQTAEQKEEKEAEAIASLIDEGTRKIVDAGKASK